ncbi:lipopolysaccharide biosynthesis protein [Rhodanobacter sp. OR87]|uniref:lipopolysaccharide biosynthesis protein n=1 Tax=Rhodanobacter sp. OR87 TaxID=1076523 RepID=UPI0031F2DCE3
MARNSAVVMLWSGARLSAQLLWVLLLARELGASSYGAFSGVIALALAMSGFAGLGQGLRMYQDAARASELLADRWRQASRVLMWSGAGLAVMFMAVAHGMFVGAGWPLLMAVAISELVLAPVVSQVAFAYASRDWMGHAAAVPVALSVMRILAVVAVALLPGGASIGGYAWLHLLATAITAAVSCVICMRELNITNVDRGLGRSDVWAGLGFSAIQASGLALGSMDKAFALRWGGEVLAGNYVAAYRFISVAVLPVDSLMMAALPHLFRAGAGRAKAGRLLLALAAATGGYGILMGAVVWWAAGLLPWLLGPSFGPALVAARMLSVYVPMYCVRTLGTNALLGFGWKRWRFGCELLALLVLGFTAAWWTPVAGLAGAVEALLAAETVLLLLIWGGVFFRVLYRPWETA